MFVLTLLLEGGQFAAKVYISDRDIENKKAALIGQVGHEYLIRDVFPTPGSPTTLH